jgi:hypothetical protein
MDAGIPSLTFREGTSGIGDEDSVVSDFFLLPDGSLESFLVRFVRPS